MKSSFIKQNTVGNLVMYCHNVYQSRSGNYVLKCMANSYDKETKTSTAPVFFTVFCNKELKTEIPFEEYKGKRVSFDGFLAFDEFIDKEGNKKPDIKIFCIGLKQAE